MKHGALVLITETEDLLTGAGIVHPKELTPNLLSSVSGFVLDESLSLESKALVEQVCIEKHLPFFYRKMSDFSFPVEQTTLDALAIRFFGEQNEWRSELPSQQTVERIELDALLDIITTANSLLQPDEVMQTVMERIHKLIPCAAWSVLIIDDSTEKQLSFAAAYGPIKEKLVSIKVPLGQGIAGWVAQQTKPIIVNNAQSDPRFLSQVDKDTRFFTKNILCAPLVSRGRTIGVIEMLNHEAPEGFSDNDLELLQTLVNPAAVAIENAYLFQKAQLLTIQDDLTKLYNSRHLNICLEAELKRAKRLETELTLIFLDLDGFKAVNDNYGHLQGSQCLIDVAGIIKKCARETDIVGRYGGDEFVLILPNTDTTGATTVAERIRCGIESYNPHGIKMTSSIGIATYPDHGQTKESLFRLADQAMYRVKEKGKNGILIACDL